eukprot:scaffold45227_cov77-Phaeocystis_antarctica.AAC.1
MALKDRARALLLLLRARPVRNPCTSLRSSPRAQRPLANQPQSLNLIESEIVAQRQHAAHASRHAAAPSAQLAYAAAGSGKLPLSPVAQLLCSRSSVFSQYPGLACSSQRSGRTTAWRGGGGDGGGGGGAPGGHGGSGERGGGGGSGGSGSQPGASGALPRVASEMSLNGAVSARNSARHGAAGCGLRTSRSREVETVQRFTALALSNIVAHEHWPVHASSAAPARLCRCVSRYSTRSVKLVDSWRSRTRSGR